MLLDWLPDPLELHWKSKFRFRSTPSMLVSHCPLLMLARLFLRQPEVSPDSLLFQPSGLPMTMMRVSWSSTQPVFSASIP